jgi:hypothetical protein
MGQLIRANAVAGMCWKCAELDRKIEHLKWMIEQLADPPTHKAANDMIEEMEAEKAKLHPESDVG